MYNTRRSALQAVKRNVSEKLKNDRLICLAAVQRDVEALQFVSEELKRIGNSVLQPCNRMVGPCSMLERK